MAVAATLGVALVPAYAFADEGQGAGAPVKLTDAQLDEVTAGRPAFMMHVHHHHQHASDLRGHNSP